MDALRPSHYSPHLIPFTSPSQWVASLPHRPSFMQLYLHSSVIYLLSSQISGPVSIPDLSCSVSTIRPIGFDILASFLAPSLISLDHSY